MRKFVALALLVLLLAAVAIPPVRDSIVSWCKERIPWETPRPTRMLSPEYAARVNALIDDLDVAASRPRARELLEAMGRGILPVLAERLPGGSESIRFEISTLLGRLLDPRGEVILASTVLTDDDKRVRDRALWALQRFEQRDFALAHLRSALTSGVTEVRVRAAVALAMLGASDGLEILHQALHDPARALNAVEALMEVQDETTSGVLVKAFPDMGDAERQGAVQVFRKIADARSVTALIFALQDQDPGVRWRACHALRFAGNESAIDPLEKLAQVEQDQMVLKHAEKAIEKLTARRDRDSR